MEGIILIIISYIFSNIAKQKKNAAFGNTSKKKSSRKLNPVSRKWGDIFNFPGEYADEAQAETVNIRDEAASVAAFQKLNHESQIEKKTTDVLDVEKKNHYIFEDTKKEAAFFKDRDSLRKAIIMSEILGKPKSINR